MAYRRRTTSRRAPARRSSYGSRRSYGTRRTRTASTRRRRAVSRKPQTVRIVVQTVGPQTSPATAQSSVVPLRAQF